QEFRSMRVCLQDPLHTPQCLDKDVTSASACNTTPPGTHTLSFHRTGVWTGDLFPGGMELSFVEGSIGCRLDPNPNQPADNSYFYGAHSRFPDLPAPIFYVGPAN